MEKYDLLPRQLLHEGTVSEENFFAPEPLTEAQVLAVHDSHYWNKLRTLQLSAKEERRSGFPLSAQLVKREVTINGGTLEAAEYASNHGGVAVNVAGGTHHAYTHTAEGF
jgi:acetoin utilization deacetylase AcuC-like enzyme